MNFSFDTIDTVEFGVCTRREGNIEFLDVPVHIGVATSLRAMVGTTWEKLNAVADTPDRYDPANESRGLQHVFVPLDDEMAALFQDVNQADRFDPGGGVLVGQPSRVFCYFARFTDDNDHRLTGMKLSKEFKGILRHRNRLARIVDDTLQMTQDDIFKLDTEFDLLVDTEEVRVLRPYAFETIGRLQEAIRAAVPQNVETLRRSLGFVDFGPIEGFAEANVSAARLLAAISNKDTQGITIESLLANCRNDGIAVEVVDEQITVEDDEVLGFLKVLNRSRYSVELIPGQREVYDASGTRRV